MQYAIYILDIKACKQTRKVRDTFNLANRLCQKLRKEGYLVTSPRPYDPVTNKTY
mgnify:CR=1 FL=1